MAGQAGPGADALIVGAGIMGLMTALHLAAAGLRVAILEQGEAAGREASWAGGGIISPLYPWRYPDSVNALAAYGQRRYPALAAALAEATGIDPEYQRCGLLMLDMPEKPLRDMPPAWPARWGLRCEALGSDDADHVQPGLGLAADALWWPDVAQIRNPRLVKALLRRLEQLEVPLLTRSEVTGIAIRAGRVIGVESRAGAFAAPCVIVTAGAWSGRLLAHTGRTLPVEPVKGQMLLFRAPPGLLRGMIMAGDYYLIPRRDGRILVGSTLEPVGFDKSTTPAAAELLWEQACRLLPALARLPVERHWAGLRPAAPAGVPFIGPVPEAEGLYVCAGQFRNGIVMAPGSADLLVDLVLGRPPVLDPAPYRVNR